MENRTENLIENGPQSVIADALVLGDVLVVLANIFQKNIVIVGLERIVANNEISALVAGKVNVGSFANAAVNVINSLDAGRFVKTGLFLWSFFDAKFLILYPYKPQFLTNQ